MGRPLKSHSKTRDDIREELLAELAEPLRDETRPEHMRDKYVFHPECPYANKYGKVTESRYVWWRNNPSDPILPGEVIHHINGNRQDNHIRNLAKLPLSGHSKLHADKRKGEQRKCGSCIHSSKREFGWYCDQWHGYIEEIRATYKLKLPCHKCAPTK